MLEKIAIKIIMVIINFTPPNFFMCRELDLYTTKDTIK